jgi:nucleoid-associated protein YgaU
VNKSSRYDPVPLFATELAAGAFSGHRTRRPDTPPGVVEHTVREWDRVDLLALHYYDDSTLWWRILDANPELLCAADLALPGWTGRKLRIPRAKGPGP